MSLETLFRDSACSVPIALSYMSSSSCDETPKCAASISGAGGYYTVSCGPLSDFASNISSQLGGTTAYAYLQFFVTPDCTGAASGFEADVLGACIPSSSGSTSSTSSGAYLFAHMEYMQFPDTSCTGIPTQTVNMSTNVCIPFAGGSAQMLYYNGTGISPGGDSGVDNASASLQGPRVAVVVGASTASFVLVGAIGALLWVFCKRPENGDVGRKIQPSAVAAGAAGDAALIPIHASNNPP
ncbi:hypothetical protein HDU83_004482 [Entophlyctis luteolus]|nr:hypothetical protein HDU83_004482 [Entophlyctis luteolus]